MKHFARAKCKQWAVLAAGMETCNANPGINILYEFLYRLISYSNIHFYLHSNGSLAYGMNIAWKYSNMVDFGIHCFFYAISLMPGLENHIVVSIKLSLELVIKPNRTNKIYVYCIMYIHLYIFFCFPLAIFKHIFCRTK